jgi:hypothetical protein
MRKAQLHQDVTAQEFGMRLQLPDPPMPPMMII